MALSKAVLNTGSVARGLKHLIALVASGAAGCRYCEAHNVSLTGRYGIAAEKLDAVWEYERDDRFDASESAALNLARDAAQVPNLTTEAHFVALKEHFSGTLEASYADTTKRKVPLTDPSPDLRGRVAGVDHP